MLQSDNQLRADNQQGSSIRQIGGNNPSETTRRTPRIAKAYLLGALHDGTYNARRKTHRFSQTDIEWLRNLKELLELTGSRSWIYKEGKDRGVYVLETSAKFLDIYFDPQALSTTEEKVAYIRGFFDAEGGVPKKQKLRFYIQFVQKDYPKLEWLHQELNSMKIKCGVIHTPSKKVDPDYFRFFISCKSYKEFMHLVGSWHPRKQKIFESRVMI